MLPKNNSRRFTYQDKNVNIRLIARIKMNKYLLSIDQGTTNSRAYIFSHLGDVISHHEIPLNQYHPSLGWAEQDPEEIGSNIVLCCQETLRKSQLSAAQISAIGITNQRETTLIWDKKTGKTIYPAIVWYDRRTDEICQQFANHDINHYIQEKTGLLLDPYFSASKIIWLLNHVPGARIKAERGELIFGTIDTFLLWRLTKGAVHATDATNASRTLLFDIQNQRWDKKILDTFDIPEILLPKVLNSSDDYGEMSADILGSRIPIRSLIGDQQAATVGQACFKAGMVKATYGTGCFVLLNTGDQLVQSRNRLLSTIAYRLNGEVTYGLEGSIFSAGTIIKWLRDKLKIITSAPESELLAQSVDDNDGVYLVPAFSGLGAPYWKPNAKAAILGLTNNSTREHIVRAGLEAVAYQTKDLFNCMLDYPQPFSAVRVDGGMAANNWLLQFISDMIDLPIHRPICTETTALGAAFLAGLAIGAYQSLEEISHIWQMNKVFSPMMKEERREYLYERWKSAVEVVIKG